ncbi:sensor histidine kinase [Promicromonospora sp. CA-289599]|uniref:sensor histidine kinase n=1 Tax=Promicromonospora sp. CA-289599 TaxID=3240014 RepID=UPI003D924595
MTTQQEPPAGQAGARPPRRVWIGALLAMVWIVFLAIPLREAAGAATAPMRVVGAAGVAGLAALFAWSFVRHWAGRSPARRTPAVLVAAELVCVALITLAAGQAGLVGLVLVCATVMMFASTRSGVVVVGAVVLALLALPRVVPGWQPEDGLVLTALLASLAIFSFRRATERNRTLHRTQQEVAVLAAAQERDRISRDMHDILGHSLTVVSVKAELATRLLRADTERAGDEVAEIQALVRSTLADMRGMVSAERQVTLAGELAAARSAFDAAGIEADLPGAVDEVAEDHREVFAWALREGTTNVLRHAAARRVTVTLAPGTLLVDDDGRGPGREGQTTGGNGLAGLTERARSVGMVVRTGPSPLGGLRLAVRVPDSDRSDDIDDRDAT